MRTREKVMLAVGVTASVVAASLFVASRWKSRAGPRVTIEGANFEMGSASGERDERPPHRVHVERYSIDLHEVTAGEYGACVRAVACTPAGSFHELCVARLPSDPELPINCVTYQQATAYCGFRSGRLPTEAEWEYAARGADHRTYPWGETAPTDEPCWQQTRGPCRVGARRADRSPFGLWDTGGNVAEWTSSAYCNYADPNQCKPGVRATRGGSFDVTDTGYLRTTFRDWVKEEGGGYNLGFRCAFDR